MDDDFIEVDEDYEGYEGESDEEDSMDDGEGCTFYSDATEWDRRRALGEHKIYGVLQTYARSSRWVLDRWNDNRAATIAANRNLGWVTTQAETEAQTPTIASSAGLAPPTDVEQPRTETDSTPRPTARCRSEQNTPTDASDPKTRGA